MTGRFHYEVVASPLHDQAHLAELVGRIGSRLGDVGGVGSPASADPSVPYAVVVGSGGTEQQVLDRWSHRQGLNPGEPLLVIAHRTDNSLPAALEALAALQQRGGHGRIVMLDRTADVVAAVQDHAAYLGLRKARIGLFGEPSDWLVASRPTAASVRDRWGPTLMTLDVAADALAVGETSVELGRKWADRDTGTTVQRSEVDRAAALHQPLAGSISDAGLDAISVRCFDLLSTAGTSGCIALAELNTTGVVAGCEGDVPSTIAMLLVQRLFGLASWMANPASIDPHGGRVELAHCTVAANLVEEVALDTHFESGIGVGISGRFRPQPVTLMRIGGVDLDRFWVADGDLVASGSSDHLCRTQASVVVHPAQAAELLDRPLGNHLVLAPGHHRDRLQRWWELYVSR